VAWRRLVKELSSLSRTIGIMAAIAVLSSLGTIIPQNKVCGRG
jgi:cytochrome c biogenesis protein